MARFNWPSGAAVDSARNLYVADSSNHTLRKATAARAVTTLACGPDCAAVGRAPSRFGRRLAREPESHRRGAEMERRLSNVQM
jgi:hypothetical protein